MTVNIAGSYGVGSVVETLPAEFVYVPGSVVPADITATESGETTSGQAVMFSLLGEQSFTYKVTAPGSPGQHEFSGVLTYGIDKDVACKSLTTTADGGRRRTHGSVSASSIVQARVPCPRVVATVTVTDQHRLAHYSIGSVVETLPAEFVLHGRLGDAG